MTMAIKTAATIGRVDECLEVRCPWCGSLDYPEDNTNEIVTCSTCGNEYVKERNDPR